MTFADIDLDDLQDCVDDCPCGRRTKENMKALAGLLMKYAIPRHQTDMNYAEFINTGNGKKGTRPAFSREQIEMIRSQIGITPHAEDVLCLIYTGMRPSELFALTKDDYRDGILYGGAKTEAGINRAVPVSGKIKPYFDQKMQSECIFLFPKDDGTQMSAKYFRDNFFYTIIAAAGIQPIPTQDRPAWYTPYSCRHAFANLLKDVQGSDKDKAALMGHAEYRTTQKHYQSATLEALKSIINSI
jgi:integrase